MWRNAFMDVEMYQFVRVMPENSVEHGSMVLKDTVKLFSLVGGEMRTIVSNCTNVSRAIIRGQDARFQTLCDCEGIFRVGNVTKDGSTELSCNSLARCCGPPV